MGTPKEKRASGLDDTIRAIPPEHAITRRYVVPAGSAAEFMAELEVETEEPTPALRALLSADGPPMSFGGGY